MRFWITRNSEVPIREQIRRQVLLGILSDDLPAGRKLPSIRAVARRHRVHANTVSAAYHDLLQMGWLELRRGSGLFVRPRIVPAKEGALDRLLLEALESARREGYGPDDVIRRLNQLVHPRVHQRIVVVEPEPAMREILLAELSGIGAALEAVDAPRNDGSLIVALPTRMARIRSELEPQTACLTLRLSSVHDALADQRMPDVSDIFTVVSRSSEIRLWARAILISVGIDAECVCDVAPDEEGWRERLAIRSNIITDAAAAGDLSHRQDIRIFRVVADSSLNELRQLCAVSVDGPSR